MQKGFQQWEPFLFNLSPILSRVLSSNTSTNPHNYIIINILISRRSKIALEIVTKPSLTCSACLHDLYREKLFPAAV